MSNFMLELGVGIKNLFREKINLVIFLVILSLGFNIYSYIDTKTSIKNNATDIKKKVDHRYFSTTTTLEKIHNIEVNTHNGELKPKFNHRSY